MAAQTIVGVQGASTPTNGRKVRTSTTASTASDVSSSSTSSRRNSKSRTMSILRCLPNRRQRKSSVSQHQPIATRETVKEDILVAPLPFYERDSRPADLDCSLFSQQIKDCLTISVPLSHCQPQDGNHHSSPLVPLYSDIFHTSLEADYVSPNASRMCAHETISCRVTAPRSPGRSLPATTPVAELALDTNTEKRDMNSPSGDASSSLAYTPTQAPAPISPLPAYMDPIEDLEIRDTLTVQARDDVATFTSLLNEKTGWKDVGVKQGVKVSRKETGHGKPALVKGTIQFKAEGATAEDVIFFFWATNPMQYNDTVEASFRLRTWSEELCVFYQSYKGAMGAQGRDFVLYGTRATSDDKTNALFVSKSCEWQKTNEMLAPRVRAQCYIGGMVCTVVSPGVLELTQIWQADLCGALPEMVKRMVAVSSVGSLAPATKLFAKNFK